VNRDERNAKLFLHVHKYKIYCNCRDYATIATRQQLNYSKHVQMSHFDGFTSVATFINPKSTFNLRRILIPPHIYHHAKNCDVSSPFLGGDSSQKYSVTGAR